MIDMIDVAVGDDWLWLGQGFENQAAYLHQKFYAVPSVHHAVNKLSVVEQVKSWVQRIELFIGTFTEHSTILGNRSFNTVFLNLIKKSKTGPLLFNYNTNSLRSIFLVS